MNAEQLFPTYLSQPGMLPLPCHARGRAPKDPRGFQDLLLRLRTPARVDTGPQSEPRKPLGSLLPSPVPGRPVPSSIVNRPQSIQPSILPPFHPSILPTFQRANASAFQPSIFNFQSSTADI
jgi:hypothetical protein